MPEPITYSEWGAAFFERAVTAERVLAGVNVLAGQPIDVGPLGIGPGRLVKLTAHGEIGTAVGERTADDPVAFDVRVPAAFDFAIDLGMDVQRFSAGVVVPLSVAATAHEDLSIFLSVTPPTPAQVSVSLQPQGLRASITQYAAGVDGELKRFVSRYVARELDQDHVRRALTIDVSGLIDQAMTTLARRGRRTPLVDDFPEALEAEIRAQESSFTDS